MFAVGVAELVCAFGILTTFSLFGTISFLGFFYILIFVKDPSRIVFENGVKRKMTEKEKKNLYILNY